MQKIAVCESGARQFNDNGTVFHGWYDYDDIGYFQVNSRYHLSQAKSMGLDIYTEQGNILYGLYLYSTEGVQPWSASKDCWNAFSFNR